MVMHYVWREDRQEGVEMAVEAMIKKLVFSK